MAWTSWLVKGSFQDATRLAPLYDMNVCANTYRFLLWLLLYFCFKGIKTTGTAQFLSGIQRLTCCIRTYCVPGNYLIMSLPSALVGKVLVVVPQVILTNRPSLRHHWKPRSKASQRCDIRYIHRHCMQLRCHCSSGVTAAQVSLQLSGWIEKIKVCCACNMMSCSWRLIH